LGIGYCEIGSYTAWAFQAAGLRPGPFRRESAVRYLWRAPATAIAVLLSAFFLSTTIFVHEILMASGPGIDYTKGAVITTTPPN
jgi:hypothetical protein